MAKHAKSEKSDKSNLKAKSKPTKSSQKEKLEQKQKKSDLEMFRKEIQLKKEQPNLLTKLNLAFDTVLNVKVVQAQYPGHPVYKHDLLSGFNIENHFKNELMRFFNPKLLSQAQQHILERIERESDRLKRTENIIMGKELYQFADATLTELDKLIAAKYHRNHYYYGPHRDFMKSKYHHKKLMALAICKTLAEVATPDEAELLHREVTEQHGKNRGRLVDRLAARAKVRGWFYQFKSKKEDTGALKAYVDYLSQQIKSKCKKPDLA